jgi:hypothetical protein
VPLRVRLLALRARSTCSRSRQRARALTPATLSVKEERVALTSACGVPKSTYKAPPCACAWRVSGVRAAGGKLN